MKKLLKKLVVVLAVVMVTGSSAMAATGTFSFAYYVGEGRTVLYSGAVVKGNSNMYMTEKTLSLTGTRTGMKVFGVKNGETIPSTEVMTPANVNGSISLSYTRAVGTTDYAKIAGYDDVSENATLSGTFTP